MPDIERCILSYVSVICNHGSPPPGNSRDYDFIHHTPAKVGHAEIHCPTFVPCLLMQLQSPVFREITAPARERLKSNSLYLSLSPVVRGVVTNYWCIKTDRERLFSSRLEHVF